MPLTLSLFESKDILKNDDSFQFPQILLIVILLVYPFSALRKDHSLEAVNVQI